MALLNHTQIFINIYKKGTNCSENAIIIQLNEIDGSNDDLIAIPNCNLYGFPAMNPTISNRIDNASEHQENAKIFMFIVLALFVACCLMFVIFGVLVWNYLKTQRANEEKRRRHFSVRNNTNSHHRSIGDIQTETDILETSSILENTPTQQKSVISYDVEDNDGIDLPGIELWKARKQPDYESPPVSPYTDDDIMSGVTAVTNATTLPPLPLAKAPLISSINSNQTILTQKSTGNRTNMTNITVPTIMGKASSGDSARSRNNSRFMPVIQDESEYQFSSEYYEPTEDSETML